MIARHARRARFGALVLVLALRGARLAAFWGETLLAGVAAPSAPPAPASSPARFAVLAGFAILAALGRRRALARLAGLGVEDLGVLVVLGCHLFDGLLDRFVCQIVGFLGLVIRDRDAGGGLRRDDAGLLQAVHLLALLDHERQLAADRRSRR